MTHEYEEKVEVFLAGPDGENTVIHIGLPATGDDLLRAATAQAPLMGMGEWDTLTEGQQEAMLGGIASAWQGNGWFLPKAPDGKRVSNSLYDGKAVVCQACEAHIRATMDRPARGKFSNRAARRSGVGFTISYFCDETCYELDPDDDGGRVTVLPEGEIAVDVGE